MPFVNLKTWLTRGIVARLYVPVLLIVVVISGLRLNLVLQTETSQAHQRMADSLLQLEHSLTPQLAQNVHQTAQVQRLLDQAIGHYPWLVRLQWQAAGLTSTAASAQENTAPRFAESTVPDWFARWVALVPKHTTMATHLADGGQGLLSADIHPQPLLVTMWSTTVAHLRITLINIALVIFGLALVLRANALMLGRLGRASGAFTQGDLNSRMAETGTLEARAVAKTFNSLATQVQTLVASLLHEKERAQITLASIGDGVITTTLDGRVETINQVAQQLIGYTEQQAYGRLLAEIFVLQGSVLGDSFHQILLHRSGEACTIESTLAPIRTPQGQEIGTVLVFRDVSQNRELLQQISWQAQHDTLTGLNNRATLTEQLAIALSTARMGNSSLAVCLLDIDHFQSVNERYGNWTGDKLLKAVAQRLQAEFSQPHTLARIGGDEFAILVQDVSHLTALRNRVQHVLAYLAEPYAVDDLWIRITASAGVAMYPADDANADTLLRHAEQAMWQAKHTGRNCLHVFDVLHDQELQSHYTRQARVAQALASGELCLYYQPKVHLRTGEIFGWEALLRWQHPEHGLLSPNQFFPWIDQTELWVDIGEWVLREALAQMQRWQQQDYPWIISVNIAARHFHRADFVQRMRHILQEFPAVPPQNLELEILETAALEDMAHMHQVMRELQSVGVRFALDDFGTGYSSLSYLKRLPAETIKIDQSFVSGVLDDREDITLVSAIVALAQAFDRELIAEGVETLEHGQRLLALGCERAQGFGIARPMAAHHVDAFVRSYTQVFKAQVFKDNPDGVGTSVY
jgi:diguanylate cyclase (GGDEF)-like protein/PAS domain S-box-containing protein